MYTQYKHVAIEGFVGRPTPTEITAIEHELGVALPVEFVTFLDVANGGYIDYLVHVPSLDDELSFCGIHSTKPGLDGAFGYGTFLGELHAERQYKRIPNAVLPFARDGGASVVYLDLTSEGNGRVIAFVHGLPAWTGLRQTDAFIEVAKSFAEYIDLLYIDAEETQEQLEEAVVEQDQERITAITQFLDIGMPNWRENIGSGL